MNEFLVFLFFVFSLLVGMLLLYILVNFVMGVAHIGRIRYKQNHRFDLPPIAECYCIDCIHRSEIGTCRYVDFKTDDDWFCKNANLKPITGLENENEI